MTPFDLSAWNHLTIKQVINSIHLNIVQVKGLYLLNDPYCSDNLG